MEDDPLQRIVVEDAKATLMSDVLDDIVVIYGDDYNVAFRGDYYALGERDKAVVEALARAAANKLETDSWSAATINTSKSPARSDDIMVVRDFITNNGDDLIIKPEDMVDALYYISRVL